MGTEFRSATEDDLEAILALWRRSASATRSPLSENLADLRTLIRGWPGSLIVAATDGEILGTIIWQYGGWRGTLYRLAVDPSQRRQGLGSSLVAEAEKRLSAAGAKRVHAMVESDHDDAMSFWDAIGYDLVSRNKVFAQNIGTVNGA